MTEAARAGYIFARDHKQYQRWRARVTRRRGESVGLTGAALEKAVQGFAALHPEYVVRGGA